MTARNRTHLPRREPGCTVEITRACYDRFKLKIHGVAFDATLAEFERATAFLRGSLLQRGRTHASIKTRTSDLLFKGSIFAADETEIGPSLSLSLELNLTRFLARNHHRLTTPTQLPSLTQAQRLSWLTIDPEIEVGRALDGSDNFISDAQVRTGTRLIQAEWLVPYIELVLAFLAGEIDEALARTPNYDPHPSSLFPRPPLRILLRNWSIRQLEVFWEFWTPNAVAEASDLVEVAETISYEFDSTRYELGRFGEGYTFGISARSHVQGVRHKLYAKLLNRLRYELTYDRITTQVERGVRLPSHPDGDDFVAYAVALTQAAAVRANHWLSSLSDAEQTAPLLITRSQVAAFFDAIYRSAPPATAGLIVAYLMARGAVPRSRAQPEVLSALLLLQRQGYVVASNPGRARHTTTYRAAPPWDELVRALRDFTSSSRGEISRLNP